MTKKMHPYLFLKDSIKNHVKTNPAVIVVGLPRSGSSYLSDILSQLENLYVFDDLYLYREARAIGADVGYLTIDQLDKLLFFLGWQIRARLKFGTFSVPDMSLDNVDDMNQALRELYRDTPVTWSELLEEWMLRLANNQGSTNWGYKAPQDFFHTDVLSKAFPGVRYIFILRDPRAMMRSLKYVHDNDGDPKQYHPLAYSLYWKSCARKIERLKEDGADYKVVYFEDLVSDSAQVAEELADYLDTTAPQNLVSRKPNSSFQDKKKKELTSTEVWLIERFTAKYLEDNGYQNSNARPKLTGIIEIIRVSVVFSFYQLGRIIKRKSALVSIKSMLRNSFSPGKG